MGLGPAVKDLNDPLLRAMAEEVRHFLRDFAELNRLTTGEDHSPRMIGWAILDTLSDWASTPPYIGQDLGMIVDRGWGHIFLRGVAASLLESLLVLHTRNYLAYSDGGVNVQTEDPRSLQALITLLRSSYEEKKTRALIAANIDEALGIAGAYSEYSSLWAFYGSV